MAVLFRKSFSTRNVFTILLAFALIGAVMAIIGIDGKSTVLLVLSLLTIMLSFGTGRTTILQGVVLLMIFAIYLFTTIVP